MRSISQVCNCSQNEHWIAEIQNRQAKMKIISICSLSVSSINTEPVSKKEMMILWQRSPPSLTCIQSPSPSLPSLKPQCKGTGCTSSSCKNLDPTAGPGTTKYLLMGSSKHLILSSVCYRTVTLSNTMTQPPWLITQHQPQQITFCTRTPLHDQSLNSKSQSSS